MAEVYLGLGSNLGDRAGYLRQALDEIAALKDCRVVAESPIYETSPMGPPDQGAFLNGAAHLRTGLRPIELIHAFQAIEQRLGRPATDQRQHWGPREIDIDLLLYDDQIINEHGLTLPHPGLHQRWFVLKPLADLKPDLMHPALGQTIDELLQAVVANSEQQVRA